MTPYNHFTDDIARAYDRDHGNTDPKTIRQTTQVLFDLAAGGRALEFAIGTGRIALPLQALGCPVSGIELSQAMVAELRKKETGVPMEVAIGNMTTTRVQGTFALVYLVFNTIDNLTTQEAQIACFQNAADHLGPGGSFVVETLVPPLQKLPFGETRLAFDCTPNHMGIDEFDITTQRYTSHHVWTRDGVQRRWSLPLRYTWPAELDLMARLAGLALEHRWGGWDRSAFTRVSASHISVWRKA